MPWHCTSTQALCPVNVMVHLWGQKLTPISNEKDYAIMLDNFQEALLQEQTRKPCTWSKSSPVPPVMALCSNFDTSQESTQSASVPKKHLALRQHWQHSFSLSQHKWQVHIDYQATTTRQWLFISPKVLASRGFFTVIARAGMLALLIDSTLLWLPACEPYILCWVIV